MNQITPITNLLGDLDCYATELDGEGWHNAANGCRAAIAEIDRLRAAPPQPEGWQVERAHLLAIIRQAVEAVDSGNLQLSSP